ncbi:aminoglycoside phosphotransferase Aph [Gottschalkia purinilytica]|uniref:Aminoglycoside phosphotransferase Aph n=1 Tax=Gottschalkia purinilytica TaxID=1503 RepID=A0A0L0WD25_GOTPU|nr:phosphotransferase family protein [Gottschalkia purinilytica]KNF09373.1 aminoglycoside phosphotransferase Aph [Gottschalkia purinilytica]
MSKIFSDIPSFHTWDIVEKINKGWSKDEKYYIKAIDGNELLLRISDISQYDNKKREFEAIKKLGDIDILMSRPIDFGICNNGQLTYSLFTWIEGEDAEKVIPTLSDKDQYQLGVKSGEFLRKMHQIPPKKNQVSWEKYYNRKINRNMTNYKECGIHLGGSDKIIKYIEQNRYLLASRPQSFQHGDYHVGNMIVTKSGELGIIDFNRFDYGDPWEEFNRITWCAGISALFASGRINGYFNNNVPELFFKLMALYIASNQLSSIHWAIPFGKKEVEVMIKQAETVLGWYDEFQTYIPNWYLPNYIE